jgi:uncharacterized protein (TIGR01777 family)
MDRVEIRAWDGVSTQGWTDLFESADALINLAGENIGAQRWDEDRKRKITQSRVFAGRAITSAFQLARRRPQTLIQASAIGYYGAADDRVMDEESPAGSDYLAHVAVQWEASTQPVEALGVRRVTIRTGIVLSKRGGALERLVTPFNLYAGGPLGSGQQWWSWIHLRDEVNAICALLENPGASGVYNLTAPNPVPMREFGQILARVLSRPYWLPAPAFALKLLLGEMSSIVLDGQRVSPDRLQKLGFTFQFPTLETALQDLLG